MFCYFCMCYAEYDGIGEMCWCWDATPESDSWVMESADWKNSGQYSSGVMMWSVKSPPTVFSYWRLVFVTFGCVTLPRRFRLGIVFGGEVWRSDDSPSVISVSDFELAINVIVYLFTVLYCDVRFCILVNFRYVHRKHVENVVETGNIYRML